MPVTAVKTISADPPEKSDRLIHRGTLGVEASVSGLAERYARGRTSHTVHVWWARRPHSAMRSLVFESLCREQTPEALEIAALLALSGSENAPELARARQLIKRSFDNEAPYVLDNFGGGGTIPFEAALLGAKTFSIDYNALSVFIQKSNLELSQAAFARLSHKEILLIVRRYGEHVLDQLTKMTEDLYNRKVTIKDKGKFAYFWTYKTQCKNCGYGFYLSKRPWLSKKKGKSIGISIAEGDQEESISIEHGENISPSRCWNGRGSGGGAGVHCPKCGEADKNPSIKNCDDVVIATGSLAKPTGKSFSLVEPSDTPNQQKIKKRERIILSELAVNLPESYLPKWSGIVNPALYGIETHADIFNPRQRVVLLELIKALRDAHAEMCSSYSVVVAEYVTSVLSSSIDQYVDWNCRLSMWISQNEQVGRAFCGPGVSMLWDYVETDAVMDGPANLWDKLERILAAVESAPEFEHVPCVQNGKAQHLPFADDTFDAVITDPPYYDNLFYNVLADFFYPWKRMLLAPIFPELFEMPQTDDVEELVASSIRQGNSDKAHGWYCEQLLRALEETGRVLKPDGILSFVYGHSSLRGWHAIVDSFRKSGLHIDTVEPLSIERRQRPRAMTSEAVNTCVVLVASKNGSPRRELRTTELLSRIHTDAETYGSPLRQAGWTEEDIGMAIFARAVAHMANAKSIEGKQQSDLEAIQVAAEAVAMHCRGFQLQNRKSL